MSTGKRKHDEIASTYYIPQRDGAADIELCTSAIDMSSDLVSESPLDVSCHGRQIFWFLFSAHSVVFVLLVFAVNDTTNSCDGFWKYRESSIIFVYIL